MNVIKNNNQYATKTLFIINFPYYMTLPCTAYVSKPAFSIMHGFIVIVNYNITIPYIVVSGQPMVESGPQPWSNYIEPRFQLRHNVSDDAEFWSCSVGD